MRGAAVRQIRAYSSTKPGATTSRSLRLVQPKKSFRFRSSAKGCSASAHGGTRLSESPSSVSRFAKAPTEYLVYERWQDLAALQAHLKAPHITTLLSEIGELLAAPPDVKVLVPVSE